MKVSFQRHLRQSPFRRISVVLLLVFVFILLLSGQWLAHAAPLHAPAVSVNFTHAEFNGSDDVLVSGMPEDVFVGTSFTFQTYFDNTGSTTGFGPFLDLVLPVTGADGNGYDLAADGVSYSSAKYLGQNINPPAQVYTFAYSEERQEACIQHPYAVTGSGAPVRYCAGSLGPDALPGDEAVNAAVGDQLVVILLPFGSYEPTQPQVQIDITVNVSGQADPDAAMDISARGGFRFGADAQNNPLSDPTILSTWKTAPFTPIVIDMDKWSFSQYWEGERVSGPNWWYKYDLQVNLAPDQEFIKPVVIDYLPDNLQFLEVAYSKEKGSNVSITPIDEPAPGTPGGTASYLFPDVTGGTGANDIEMRLDHYVPFRERTAAYVIDPDAGSAVAVYNQMAVSGEWMAYDARDRIYAHTLSLNLTGDTHGQVTSSPGGISCGQGSTDCSEDYLQGTPVTLNAAVDGGYVAVWSGACAGTSGNTCSLTMSENQTVSLNISPLFLLSVDLNGSANGVVTSAPAGIACGESASDCSASFSEGSTVTLSAAPQDHYVAVWGGACSGASGNTCDVNMSAAQTVELTFSALTETLDVSLSAPEHGTIASAPAGIDCGGGATTCAADFLEGSAVTLTAAPESGYGLRWGGDCAGESGLTCTLDLTASRTVSAEFLALRDLSVDLTGGENGQITASGGLACGGGSAVCSAGILDGTSVTLYAAPDPGFDVTWGGDCAAATENTCTLSMDAAKNVTALIAPVAAGYHTLNVTLSGAANGQVTSIPAGILCGAGEGDCFQVLIEDDTVGLTAAPLAHYEYTWGGDCAGTSGDTCDLTMDTDHTVTLNFSALSQTLTVSLSDANLGAVSSSPAGIACGNGDSACSAGFDEGSSVILSAAPDAGYSTVWGGACASASGETCTVSMDAAVNVSVAWLDLTPTKTPTPTRTPFGMPSPTPSSTPSPTRTPTATATPQGVFTPIPVTRDPNDHAPQSVGYEDRFWAKSLAIQDGMSVVGGTKFLPGALMQVTLSFQVSDYFAFQNLILQDTLPDGLRWFSDETHKPRLTISDNPATYNISADFGSTNINVDESRISCLYPPDAVNCAANGGHGDGVNSDGTDGKTVITFDLSAELLNQGKDGKLVGGCLPSAPRASGTGSGVDPECVDNGDGTYSNAKTTGTLVFYAQVQEEFSDDAPSGDLSVDQGDRMTNASFISGQILRYDDMSPQGTVTDGDGSSSQIAYGTLEKYIYAINGVTAYEGNPEFWKDGHPVISPGDRVTYELNYVTNSSDMEDFKLDDFLPSPIFINTEITTLDLDGDGNALRSDDVPAPGHAHLALDDTFYPYTISVLGGNGLIPNIEYDTGNVLRFYYGNFDGSSNTSKRVHIYFTVTVQDEPVADGLFLTNQARSREGSTNAGERLANSIVQIEINSPMLNIQKGVVAVSGDASTVFAPTAVAYSPAQVSPAGMPFKAPETDSGSCPRVDAATWTLSSDAMGTDLETFEHANALQSDAAYLDAGDRVTFAIVVENTGAGKSGAFDIRLTDTLDARMDFVPGSLCVSLGDGTTLVEGVDYAGDLFSGYLEFLDRPADVSGVMDSSNGFLPPYQWGLAPAPTPPAPGAVDNAATGKNVILVTYDVTLNSAMEASEVLQNTAALSRYTSSDESTINFVENLEDSATVSGNDPKLEKTLDASEIENGQNTKAQLAIGETATYALMITLPEGTLSNASIDDVLAEGLAFVDILSVSSTPAEKIKCGGDACTPADFSAAVSSEGSVIAIDLGTIVNEDTDNTTADTLTIRYRALALDRSTNQSAPHEQGPAYLSNSAVLSWEDVGGSPESHSLAAVHADSYLSIIEPVLKIEKSVAVNGSAVAPVRGDAGDPIAYTLTISHDADSDTAAYDIQIQDLLPNKGGAGSLILDPLLNIACTGVNPQTACAAGDVVRSGSDATSWTIAGDADGFDLGLGDSATITITGTLSALNLRAGETFDNEASLTWTSLDGAFSTPRSTYTTLEKSTERDGGGSVDDYSSASAKASASGATPKVDKQTPSPAQYAIGASVPYDILVTLPEGVTPGLQVIDQVPDGMVYNGYQVITLAAGSGGILTGDFNGTLPAPGVSPGGPFSSGQDMTFTFGDATAAGDNDPASDSFILRVYLTVLNIPANQAGVTLENGARLIYSDPVSGDPVTLDDTPVEISLVEPALTISKQAPEGTPDGGDALEYKVTLANPGGSDGSPAYDVRLKDLLPAAYLSLDAGSVSVELNGCGVGPASNDSTGNTLDVTIPEIPEGCGGIVVAYTAELRAATQPGFEVNNRADVTWTSQSGGAGEERTGADGEGGALNDYAASSSDAVTTMDVAGAEKSIVQTSETLSLDDRVLIGEIVRFRLQVRLPESTATNLILHDSLPDGLTFLDDGTAMAAFVSTNAGTMHSATLGVLPWQAGDETTVSGIVPAYTLPDAAVSASSSAENDTYASGTDVYFKLGDLTNEDDDDDQEFVLVEFNALAGNTLANQSGTALANSFRVLVDGDERAASGDVAVTLAEPIVALTKLATTPALDAGDAAIYTITLTNTAIGVNAAPAFDLRLQDALGSYLDLAAAGDVVVTSKPAYTTVSDSTNAATEQVDVNFSRLDAGDSIELTVTAALRDSAPAGLSLPNTGRVTYTSLPATGSGANPTGSTTPGASGAADGERSGVDGVGGALNDYAAQGSVSFTLNLPSVDKLTPVPAAYTIGEQVTYSILVTLPEGETRGLVLVDDLPSGMAYVSHTVITGAASSGGLLAADFNGTLPAASVSAPGGSGADLSLTFGNTTTTGDNDAGNNRFLVNVVAQVLNLSANQAGTTLGNTARLSYTDPNDGSTDTLTNGPEMITVSEPIVTVAKTGPLDTLKAGDNLTYTVTLTSSNAANTSIPYDVHFTDALVSGLTLGTVTISDACSGGTVNNSTAATVVLDIASMPPGCSVTVEYTASIGFGIAPGQQILNTGRVTWTSMSGTVSEERTGVDGVGGALNDLAAQDTHTFNVEPAVPEKTIAATSESHTTLTGGYERLAVGEIVRYRAVVQLPTSVSTNLQIHDRLPAGLQFLNDGSARAAFVSDNAGACAPATMTSTTLGTAPWVCGSDADVAGITPSYALPDAAVSASAGANNDTYADGTDVYFSLGTVTNSDNDDNKEYLVIEFNALVRNVAANTSGRALANDFLVLVNGATNATSSAVTAYVALPTLTLSKAVTTPAQDAGDTAVYTLTITNTASGNNAAAAFDVRIQDILNTHLDLSDIGGVAATLPGYATLTNNSDPLTETVDATISQLNPGDSATLTISPKIKSSAPAGFNVPNTAGITYTTLPVSGTTPNPTGSVTPGASGAVTGERNGAGTSPNLLTGNSSASFTLATPAFEKSDASPATYAVGATVSYDLLLTLREGVTRDLTIEDDLPAGLAYSGYSIITSSAASAGLLSADYGGGALPPPAVTAPGGSGADLILGFGDTTNTPDGDSANDAFIVRVSARVVNESANQTGTTLVNTGRLKYTNPNTLATVTLSDSSANITLFEPDVTLTKTITSAPDPVDALGVIAYQVVAANGAGANVAAAYDLVISDALPSGLNLESVSISDSPAGCAAGETNASAGNTLTVKADSLPAACSLTVAYSARIADSAIIGGTFENTAEGTWTSLSGDVSGERTGADGPGGTLNDYAGESTADLAVSTSALGVDKTLAGAASRTVGDTVTYDILVTLPEGTLNGLVLTDDLPAGLLYTGHNLITNAASSGGLLTADYNGTLPAPAASPAAPPGTSGQDLVLTFGDVVTAGDDDTTNNRFLVKVTAQVANESAVQAGSVLANTASIRYTHPVSGATTLSDAPVDLTISEPSVSSSKSIVSLPTPVDAGGEVAYRIVLTNAAGANASPAYDVHAADILDAALERGTETLSESPPDCAAGEAVVAGGNDVILNATSMAPGCTLTLDFTVTLRDGVEIGASVENEVNTTWTSMPGTASGERSGADGVGGALNDYASASSAALDVSDAAISVTKSLASAAALTIGETAQYNILVTLPEGTTRNLRLTDLLPDGLRYSGFSVVRDAASSGGLLAADFNGTLADPTVTPAAPGASGADAVFSFGDALTAGDEDPTNNTFLLRLDALAANENGNQHGVTLANRAEVKYDHAEDGEKSLISAPVDLTLREASLTLTKDVSPVSGIKAGDALQYTVTITNANASAYEVTVVDDMPDGIAYNSGTLACMLTDASGTSAVLDYSGGILSLGTWDIAAGGSVQCTYAATAQNSLALDGTIENTADADWSSLDGAASGERVYDDTPGITADGAQDGDTASFTVDGLTFAKSDGGVSAAAIGEEVTYTLTASGPTGTVKNLVVADSLPAGFIYTGNLVIQGLPAATPVLSGPNDGSAPLTVTWDFGDALKTLADATIVFTARAANVAANQADGALLTNEAALNYDRQDGTPAAELTASDTLQLVEPALTLTKEIADAPVPVDAGGVITYRVTLANPPGANAAAAYDVSIRDNLADGLTLGTLNVTLNGGASGAARTVSGNDVIYTIDAIPVGGDAVIEYQATLTGTGALEAIDNRADATWTSVNGAVPGERSGADGEGGALNDYAAHGEQSITTEGAVVSKALAGTSLADTAGTLVTIGEILTYRISVALPEGSISSLSITDDLPAGLIYVPSSVSLNLTDFDGTVAAPTVNAAGGSGGDVEMLFGAITVTADNDPANNILAIDMQASVADEAGNVGYDSPTSLENNVTLEIDGGAPLAAAPLEVSVAEPHIVLTKSVIDPADGQAAPGQTVTFQITAQNTGLSTAYETVIEDALPEANYSAILELSTPADFTYSTSAESGQVVVKYSGDLAAGASRTFTFSATLDAIDPSEVLTNTAEVTSATTLPGSDPAEREEPLTSASADVNGFSIDLRVSKDDQIPSGDTALPGAGIVYRLDYANAGNRSAGGVTIVETIPDGTTFDGAASTPGWTCDVSNCVFSLGTLAAAASGTLDFAVTVDDPISLAALDNSVTIDDDHAAGSDSNPADNSAAENTPLGGAPDLTITKDDGTTVTAPGAVLTYTLVITNVGNRGATGVAISDRLPDTVTFVSASDGGLFDSLTRKVAWPLTDLDGGGAFVNRTVTVQVNDTLPPGTTTITTEASVTDDGTNGTDPTPENNLANDMDMLGATAKSIRSTSLADTDDSNVAVGEIVTYEVTVSVPSASVDNLVLTDVLDAGMAFVRCVEIIAPAELVPVGRSFAEICAGPLVASEPDGSADPVYAGRKAVFNFGTVNNTSAPLAPQAVIVRYEAVLLDTTANVPGTSLRNQALWTWTGGSSTVVAAPVTIVEPHLRLVKTVAPRNPIRGGEVLYTLTVTHRDDSVVDAYNAELVDRLPDGLRYVDSSLTFISGQTPDEMTFSPPRRIEVKWDRFADRHLIEGDPEPTILQFRAEVVNPRAGARVVNDARVSYTSLPEDGAADLSLYNTLSRERFYDPMAAANADARDTAAFEIPSEGGGSGRGNGWFGAKDGDGLVLPATGFPPGRITVLPQAPYGRMTPDLDGLRLEIETIRVNAPLTGVPLKDGAWDLTWLGSSVGYLEGTTYPASAGNTGLTGHVFNADGSPGVFVNLSRLQWGDAVVLHSGGMRFKYAVREVRLVAPDEISVLQHKDSFSWLTLLTCRGYDERSNAYAQRVVVQAVLVGVDGDMLD